MPKVPPTVSIIDNDQAFCRSTEMLIHSISCRVKVEVFGTARQFLCRERPAPPACVVLETRLPGLSGLDVQQKLDGAGITIPLIFVTRHGDIAMAVQAMKHGAVDFLTKPVREAVLIEDIQQAFQRDEVVCQHQQRLAVLRANYEQLTPAEREVMAHVISGLLNKETASHLTITEKTVKFHRAHIMRKMKAQSLVDLVRMAEQLGIFPCAVPNGYQRQWTDLPASATTGEPPAIVKSTA